MWDFPSSNKEKGQSVVMEELNPLAVKVRSLKELLCFKINYFPVKPVRE